MSLFDSSVAVSTEILGYFLPPPVCHYYSKRLHSALSTAEALFGTLGGFLRVSRPVKDCYRHPNYLSFSEENTS